MTKKAKNHLSSEQNLRTGIALNASYEISVIVGMLQREHERDSSELDILLTSMLRRIDRRYVRDWGRRPEYRGPAPGGVRLSKRKSTTHLTSGRKESLT